MSKMLKRIVKILLIGGAGILGYSLYKQYPKKKAEITSRNSKILTKELEVFSIHKYTFLNKLINEDLERLKNNTDNEKLELSCTKYSRKVYEQSMNYHTKELIKVIKAWHIYNLVLECYLSGSVSFDELEYYFIRFEFEYANIENLIQYYNIEEAIKNNEVIDRNKQISIDLIEEIKHDKGKIINDISKFLI